MKKLAICIAAPLALAAMPALAQNATGTVNINGSVAGRCLFTTPSQTIDLGELALPGTDTAAGRLDLTKVNGQSTTLVGWCNNSAASMTVEATKLTNPASAASGFTNSIDYRATATANSISATDTTTVAGAGSPSNVGMFAGNIGVSLSDATSDSSILVAGSYTGLVTVTLAPNYVAPTP